MNLGSKHGCRIDYAAGSDHEAEVAFLQVLVGGSENVTIKTFTKPDHMGAEKTSAAILLTPGKLGDRDLSGIGLWIRGASVSESLTNRRVRINANIATLGAPGLEEVAMQLNNVGGARALMEAVNVLGDHHNFAALTPESVLNLGDGGVSWVRALGPHDLPSVVIELPDKGRVLMECLRSREVLSLICSPESSGSSEGRDPALCRDSGSCEDHEVSRGGEDLPEACHVGHVMLLVLGGHVDPG